MKTMTRVAMMAAGFFLLGATGARADEVEGFRSAKFGQKEAEVAAAMVKDLAVKKDAIERKTDEALGVVVLSAKVASFAPLELPATVNYVMGSKCACLVQVNMAWEFPKAEKDGARKTAMRGVGALVGKFTQDKWGKDETIVNRLPKEAKEGEDGMIIFFRGQNAKGGAITLAAAPVKLEKAPGKTELVANVDHLAYVSLVYEKNALEPDVQRTDVSGF